MLYFTYREQYSIGEVIDMFNIRFVDIGGDGLMAEFNSPLDTLVEVEILIVSTLNEKLGVCCIQLVHDGELVYTVWLNGHDIGVVSIKDVNPAPLKRK